MNSLHIGTAWEIKLKLNNWFLAALIIFFLAGILLKALAVFISVLWHECAHAFAAVWLGYRVREVELLPFGGVARIENLNKAGARDEFIMAAAGPVSSLILAAAIWCAVRNFHYYSEFYLFILDINIMLAVFNLLPALPLDGGRMIRAILSKYFDFNKATVLMLRTAKLLSIILLLLVIYDVVLKQSINITFLFAAVFLYVSAKTELEIVWLRTMEIITQKKASLLSKGIMNTTHITVLSTTAIKEIMRLIRPDSYYIIIIIDGNFQICGQLTESQVWDKLPDKGIYAQVGEFL